VGRKIHTRSNSRRKNRKKDTPSREDEREKSGGRRINLSGRE
jgi:hypothetical protein